MEIRAYKPRWSWLGQTRAKGFARANFHTPPREAARAGKHQLKWAKDKKNKKNPHAKAILKRHKKETQSLGGKALNKAGNTLYRGAVKAGLTALNVAKQKTLQFLGLLPGMASNLHKMSVQGARFNLPREKLAEYKSLSQRIGLAEDGSSFTKALSLISEKLANPITGDLSGMIGKIAALDSRVSGRVIDESVKVFTEMEHNPEALMKAVINTIMKASMQGVTLTKTRLNANDAFFHNLSYASAFGNDMKDIIAQLFEFWQLEPSASKKVAVTSVVTNDGDMIEATKTHLLPGERVITDSGVAGALDTEKARNVTTKIDELKADWKAVIGGILIKILAQLEPMVNYVRSLLKSFLSFLSMIPGFGGLAGTVVQLNVEDIAYNASALRSLEPQRIVAEDSVKNTRKKYGVSVGVSDKEARLRFERAKETGLRPNVMSQEAFNQWISDEAVYWHIVDTIKFAQDQLRPDNKNVIRASDIDPISLGRVAAHAVISANIDGAKLVEEYLGKFTNNKAKYVAERESLNKELERIDEAEKDSVRGDWGASPTTFEGSWDLQRDKARARLQYLDEAESMYPRTPVPLKVAPAPEPSLQDPLPDGWHPSGSAILPVINSAEKVSS
ncbi:MAG: hypothetical protein LBD22_00385, partial [Spirochaetaceae bacterium]|nr:hypothetical protein [Spirochaetaceae bacterium]